MMAQIQEPAGMEMTGYHDAMRDAVFSVILRPFGTQYHWSKLTALLSVPHVLNISGAKRRGHENGDINVRRIETLQDAIQLEY